MTTYRVVIRMIQKFEEVIEVDASNVQQARSQARAATNSLEFKLLVETDYQIESITRANPLPLQKDP